MSIAARDARSNASFRVAPEGVRSASRLAELRGAWEGHRCFIVGNGPSLNSLDLSRLKGEVTFGLNRGYLLADRIGSDPTYLVVVNKHVVDQYADEILASGSLKLLSWRARPPKRRAGDGAIYFRTRTRPGFYRDVGSDGVWEGATVTYVALQLAFYFGFREAVLIGVDHFFFTSGEPNKLVVANAPDPNHFDPNYFGPGVRWQLPDLATSEVAYAMARDAYESAGKRVINATAGGKLEVFERQPYDSLVGSRFTPERGA